MPHLDFEPVGRRVSCKQGANLLEVAREAGITLDATCGGAGTCGKCRVKIDGGELAPPSPEEARLLGEAGLAVGQRLACQVTINTDAKVILPAESSRTGGRLQIAGLERQVAVDGVVKEYALRLEPATLADARSDDVRLCHALSDQHGLSDVRLSLAARRELPQAMRANHWSVTAVLREHEVVRVAAPHAPLLGLAVDIGTSKVAAYLVDLVSGDLLSSAGALNSQIAYGEDLMSRLTFALESGEDALRRAARDDLNRLVEQLCSDAAQAREDIVEAVIVGNTAMHHLFLGLPVRRPRPVKWCMS